MYVHWVGWITDFNTPCHIDGCGHYDAIYARSVVALLFQFETEQPSVSDMALRIEVNIEAYECFMA